MKSVLSPRRLAPILAAHAVAVFVAVLMAVGVGSALAAPGDPLVDYSATLVTNYVSRGVDVFRGVQDKEGKEHSAFNISPALQPSVTLYGPSGLYFNLWGDFALTNRGEDKAKSFPGLKELDEVDYTLAWSWKNRVGGFGAGIVSYANVPDRNATNEIFVRWSPPVLEALSPSITHYVHIGTAHSYTTFAVAGGEKVTWAANLGLSTKGPQDLTGSVGTPIGDTMSVSLNASYRPTPALLGGPYDSDGKYTVTSSSGTTKTATYPSTILWLAFTYGGSVKE